MLKKLLLSTSLLALSLEAETLIDLGQISVTATKKETLNLEQPLSVSQKSQKELELDQALYQKDLLNSLSGVRIEQTTSGLGHMTAIRMPLNTSAYYLFLQDGVYLQSSGFFNHNGLAYGSFLSGSGVEVIKGTGTALYGSDAMAGTVNIKTLKRAKKKLQSIELKGGSFGYGSLSYKREHKLSDTKAYSMSAHYSHKEGYREHSSFDRGEFNLRYDYDLSDESSLKTIFNSSKTDALQADSFEDISYIKSQSTKASDDADYYTALSLTDVRRQFDFVRLSSEYTKALSESSELSLTPYFRYNRNRYIATWENNLPSSDNELNTLGLLGRVSMEFDSIEFIGGFDSEYTQSRLLYNQDFTITTTGWGGATYPQGPIFNYDVIYTALAPYARVAYKVNDALRATVGLRYDYARFDYTNNLADGSDASGIYYRPADRSDTFTHLSPKASISYTPAKSLHLYARYANGFSIPSASRLYSRKAGYLSIELDPEKSNTYELGIKKLFGAKEYFELNLYNMEVFDTFVRDSTNNTYYNGGKTTHGGAELTLFAKLSKAFFTKLAYSYSEHFFVNDVKYNNNEMANAPRHTANARLFFKPNGRIELMAELSFISDYYMDDDNTKSYEGYTVGNLKASYKQSKELSFFAKVDNVTNQAYATRASYAYGSNRYTPAEPRSYYMGVRYQW